jgi:hypothetical protein
MSEENLISKGRHRAMVRVSEDAIQVSADVPNKSDFVAVCFDLCDPQDPYNGWSITWFGFLTDKTLDRTVEGLRYCGWEGDEIGALPELAANGQLSQEVELVIDHEEWEGKWRAKVKWVNRPGGGTVKLEKKLTGSDLSSFSARMKGRIRTAGAANANGRTTPQRSTGGGGSQPQHPNAPGNLDDIPF